MENSLKILNFIFYKKIWTFLDKLLHTCKNIKLQQLDAIPFCWETHELSKILVDILTLIGLLWIGQFAQDEIVAA